MYGITSTQILSNEGGRWGNQLFRIALMIAYAKKYNCNYYIAKQWMNSKYFKNSDNFYDINIISQHIKYIYNEVGFHYNNIPKIDDGILEIDGYFQSYKYFDDYKNDILAFMDLDENILKYVDEAYKIKKNSICIHVRLGDIFDKNRGRGYTDAYHPALTINYYNNAILTILNKTNIDQIYIFTDHQNTKDFIQSGINTHNINTIYFDYKDEFIHDFIAQTQCDHFIIANSTFSWWSAYLAKNSNKIVCCPFEKDWFGYAYKHFIMSDLLPENWIRIEK